MKTWSAFSVLALALLLAPACRAQSADMPRHGTSVTGLNDPEPAEPRYLATAQLRQLQDEYPAERVAPEPPAPNQPAPTPPPATPNQLPAASMSLRRP